MAPMGLGDGKMNIVNGALQEIQKIKSHGSILSVKILNIGTHFGAFHLKMSQEYTKIR